MPRLLQFTDMHLRDDPAASVRGVVVQRCFEEILYHARRRHWPPDAILLTGDLANDEFEESYVRLADMASRWEMPVLAVPGNHDDAKRLRSAFDRVPLAADDVIDLEGWRIVGLDSQAPGKVHGELSKEALDLLEDAAATRGERHLLVALHHQPLDVGSAWLEDIGLHGADTFRAQLARLGARACLFGHAHQAWESEEDGVRYLGTPSTGRQFVPGSDSFAESADPPAYRSLALRDNGHVDTAVMWLERP